MDTTTAATQAGVTRATIRHWARMGAIAATKTAGRWTIDETSLTRRIALTHHTRSTTVDQPQKPWDDGHPNARFLDEALAAGMTIEQIVEISDWSELRTDRPLRRKEEARIGQVVWAARERAEDAAEQAKFEAKANLATPRQVDYIASLLNTRRRQGLGGGFAGEDSYYLPDGRVNLAKIRKMTKSAASSLISSLRQDY